MISSSLITARASYDTNGCKYFLGSAVHKRTDAMNQILYRALTVLVLLAAIVVQNRVPIW